MRPRARHLGQRGQRQRRARRHGCRVGQREQHRVLPGCGSPDGDVDDGCDEGLRLGGGHALEDFDVVDGEFLGRGVVGACVDPECQETAQTCRVVQLEGVATGRVLDLPFVCGFALRCAPQVNLTQYVHGVASLPVRVRNHGFLKARVGVVSDTGNVRRSGRLSYTRQG